MAKLPSRAKPEMLHQICRQMESDEGIEKSEVSENLSGNRRSIRATIDYGDKLRFLDSNDGRIKLTPRGWGISLNSDISDEAVVRAFRESIEEFQPYRESLIKIHSKNLEKTVKGNESIKQSDLKQSLYESIDTNVENREVNLLIKTAAAAGLGEFMTGRKGLETRLVLSDEYFDYIEKLCERYPHIQKEDEEPEKNHTLEKDTEASKSSTSAPDKPASELKLTIELDVNDKADDEIISLVRRIQDII